MGRGGAVGFAPQIPGIAVRWLLLSHREAGAIEALSSVAAFVP